MISEEDKKHVLSVEPGRYFEIALANIYREVLQSRPGCAIDGGSNSGLHAIGMALALGERPGQVYAIDPQAALLERAKSWADNRGVLDRMSFLSVALGDRAGRLEFFVDTVNPAMSSLCEAMVGDHDRERVEVDCVRMDDVVAENDVRFIKLDLEGGEYHALLGAERLVRSCKPIIAFENGLVWAAEQFGYPPSGIPDLLGRWGYEAIDFFGRPLTSDSVETKEHTFMFLAGPPGEREFGVAVQALAEFWDKAGQIKFESWPEVVDLTIKSAEGKRLNG